MYSSGDKKIIQMYILYDSRNECTFSFLHFLTAFSKCKVFCFILEVVNQFEIKAKN